MKPWYLLKDSRGWSFATNCRDTAADMFRRMKKSRGKRTLARAAVDGKTVWPEQTTMELS